MVENNDVVGEELPGGCMVGSLESWPLLDILVWLHQSRRTAMLRVGSGLDAGVIFFREGWLYRAEWSQTAGAQAVLSLLGVRTGKFSLLLRDIPYAQANVQAETRELLMQLTLAQDEMTRRAASA